MLVFLRGRGRHASGVGSIGADDGCSASELHNVVVQATAGHGAATARASTRG